MGQQSFIVTETFITESGEPLTQPKLAYESWGTLNAAKDNVILICHALTGNTNAREWFSGLFEDQGILHSDEYYVLCINHPGSCYGSVGPTSINPATNKSYQIDFPDLTIRDIVELERLLLDKLEITGIELIIGGSMGGMIALEFMLMDQRIRKGCLMAMGKAHTSWAIGISHAQRLAIKADGNWNSGRYTADNRPLKGLAAARAMAMVTYRTPENYERRFQRNWNIQKEMYETESYLNYQGDKINQRFDANTYITLSKAMDSHDISRGRGNAQSVLNKINIPVLVLGINSDLLYPIAEQIELATLIPTATFGEITSRFGHDAFLIEFEQINAHLRSFFRVKKQLSQ